MAPLHVATLTVKRELLISSSSSIQWVPRRAVAKSGPRPIHLIRHEVYQESSPHMGHAHPPPPLQYPQQGFRGTYNIIIYVVILLNAGHLYIQDTFVRTQFNISMY